MSGKSGDGKKAKGSGKGKGQRGKVDGMASDSRFSHITNDQRYKPISRKETTVKIDDRFKKMFTDKSFGTTSAFVPRPPPAAASYVLCRGRGGASGACGATMQAMWVVWVGAGA